MRQYLRLILEQGPENYTITEEQKLRDCLSSAPSIDTVEELKRHPRGGYTVTMERIEVTLKPLIEYLSFSGYRAVI